MKTPFLAASTATALAVSLVAMPAYAVPSTLFDDNIVIGNVYIQVNSDEFGTAHMYGWAEDATQGSSTAHRNAELSFYDVELDDSEYVVCDSGTADETQDGDDLILTCDETDLADAFAGLSVKSEFRAFPADENGVAILRVLYAVTNSSNEDISVDELRSTIEFDDYFGEQRWSGDGSLYGAAEFDNDTDVNWYALGVYSDADDTPYFGQTTFGSAWQNDDADVTFAIDGALTDEEFTLTTQNVVFPAGATRYFAFFTVGAYVPEDASVSDAEAIIDNTFAAMANFDGVFDGTLAAGIPAGADVANWVTTEELAETGADVNAALSLAGAMALVGAAAIMIRRRTRA